MAAHHEELLRQPVQEVRAAIRTMSQPNHSNVNAQVYPVFLDAGNLIQGRAARKFLAFQTPDKHRRIGTSNVRNRTNRLRSKAIQNAPFLCDLLLLAGSTVNVIPRQGRTVRARVALSTAMCSMYVSNCQPDT